MKKILIYVLLQFALTEVLLASNNLVWPQPPENARIKFDKVITKPEDAGIKKGFFTKIWEFFAGEENQIIVKPFGIHVDGKKTYFTDAGLATLFIFDREKNRMKSIQGFKSEKFRAPIDVATDSKGNIFVTDAENRAVYVFNDKGIALSKFGSANDFLRPTGIAIDKDRGLVYVTDTVASQIKRFTLTGIPLAPIGKKGNKKGELNRPTFIALDSDGKLYVCDSMNFRVNIYDKDTTFLRTFGKLGNAIGSFASPRGIAVDKDGNIYVTDTLFNAVQIFDKSGNLLLVFGSEGKEPGQFYGPQDIAISSDGKAYVTDSYNMRIEVFDILSHNRNK